MILDYFIWEYIFSKRVFELSSSLELVSGAYFLHIFPLEIFVI